MGEVAEEGDQEGGERVPREPAAEEGQVISPTGRAWQWVARASRRKGHPERSVVVGCRTPRRASGAGTLPPPGRLGTIPDPRMERRENRAQEEVTG